MTDDIAPDKEDEIIDAALKGGKELMTSLSKAGLLFTKRMAEGAFNAQIAQSDKHETSDKIKVAGKELGRAFVKGAIEGAAESFTGFINGINAFSQEMARRKQDEDEGNFS